MHGRRPHHARDHRRRPRAAAARAVGARGPRRVVPTEPFRQWVIEDRFAGPRPGLGARGRAARGRHGAVRAAQAARAERFALDARLPRAARGRPHGGRGGRDHAIAGAVRRLVEEDVAPTLAPELDLPGYVAALDERFANPRMGHRLEQIAADGCRSCQRGCSGGSRTAGGGGRAALGRAGRRGVGAAPPRRRRPRRGRRAAPRGARAAPARAATAAAVLRRPGPVTSPRAPQPPVFRDLITDWLARLARGARPPSARLDGSARPVAGPSEEGVVGLAGAAVRGSRARRRSAPSDPRPCTGSSRAA